MNSDSNSNEISSPRQYLLFIITMSNEQQGGGHNIQCKKCNIQYAK